MSKKNIILIVIISILFIAAIIGIYFFTKNNEELTVTGKVIINGEGYVIIESDNEDYLVNEVTNNYNIGDEVTFTYKKGSLKEDNSPKEIEAIKEELIKKNNSIPEDATENGEQIEENKQVENPSSNNQTATNNTQNNQNNETNQNSSNNETNNTINNQTKNNENIDSNPNANNSNVVAKSADEAVLEYVRTVENDATEGITDTLKSGFITVVDFLFYNGTIAGHTFNELTTSAKLEVLKAALWIDDKVDSVFPGYKETISSGASKAYNSVKNLIVSTYLDITSSICESNASLCAQAKEDFQSLKTSFGLTWDFLKGLASSGLDKLKNWYEIWSGK